MIKYTDSHEWIFVEGDVGTVGVSDYAQQELGEIVYIELPQVGQEVSAGQEAAVLESTKAASDVYSPVSGVIKEINSELNNTPEKVNDSPLKDGWLFKIQLADTDELEQLLTEEVYLDTIK